MEIKLLLHQVDVVICVINDVDGDYFTMDELLLGLSNFREVYWFIINKSLVRFHLFRFGKHGLSD